MAGRKRSYGPRQDLDVAETRALLHKPTAITTKLTTSQPPILWTTARYVRLIRSLNYPSPAWKQFPSRIRAATAARIANCGKLLWGVLYRTLQLTVFLQYLCIVPTASQDVEPPC